MTDRPRPLPQATDPSGVVAALRLFCWYGFKANMQNSNSPVFILSRGLNAGPTLCGASVSLPVGTCEPSPPVRAVEVRIRRPPSDCSALRRPSGLYQTLCTNHAHFPWFTVTMTTLRKRGCFEAQASCFPSFSAPVNPTWVIEPHLTAAEGPNRGMVVNPMCCFCFFIIFV